VTGLRLWFVGALLSVPSLFLCLGGVVHYRNGAAVDAAFPVPLDISLNAPLPRMAYTDAIMHLAHTARDDGDDRIALAQASFLAGETSPKLIDQMRNSLSVAPASAQGWVFYGELQPRSV